MPVVDVLGNELTFMAPPRRVVSLVPSLTETLFELGVGESVVGITDFCIFPERLELPRVGGTKNPRVEQIRELRPDLVYVNLEENLKRHADAIAEFAPLFVTEPKTIDDCAALIRTLAAIHAVTSSGELLATELERVHAAMAPRNFTFACPIWKKPWMWCGGDTYVSHLVAAAGGRNVIEELERYPAVALDDVLARKPEIIFLPDEPYEFTEEDAAELRARGPRIIGPFAGHLFTWHGTRTIRGLQFLRDALAT
jgi:ABC-type Fe3+-hydroxamate transport system substrate-binding protein